MDHKITIQTHDGEQEAAITPEHPENEFSDSETIEEAKACCGDPSAQGGE